jgi:hypothetical protein
MKYRPYSRREFRERFRQWRSLNRKRIGVLIAVAVVVVVVETTVLITVPMATSVRWYVLGIVHTAVVVGLAFAVRMAFLAQDTAAIVQMRGAWGEEATRDELARARRRRLIWGWVDSINLQSGDIDHLVVTRAGGLVAIDSKWRNQADPAGHQAMVRAAGKMRLRSEAVFQSLLKSERGSHRALGSSLRVTPLVVLWGAVQSEVPDGGACIDGIDFVAGGGLLAWFKKLDGERVDKAAARDILRRVESFRSTAWAPAIER